MMEADRVLEPVAPDAPAIRALREYASAAALGDALRATVDAIEQSLRLLLRSDVAADEADRLRAMSPQELAFPELLERLRARDRISIALAGTIHELRRIVEEGGTAWSPRPADADRALDVIGRLRREVRALDDETVREAAQHTVRTHWPADGTRAVPPDRKRGRRLRTLAGPLLALIALCVSIWLLVGTGSALQRGIAAFSADRDTEAISQFREAVRSDPQDPTPRLYLGRIYRRQDRFVEAADQLEAAVRLAPRDPQVRRELGYLFFDLHSYEAAVRQFERAVELEPASEAGWLGLTRSMRRADDPRLAATLARAPAAIRMTLESNP